MIINILLFGLISFWFLRNIKRHGILWIAKGSLQIGILILFIGAFFKLFIMIPSSLFSRLIFCLIYVWSTIGINVNFMIPLIDLIDRRIDKNK